jgi:hypothetical protein
MTMMTTTMMEVYDGEEKERGEYESTRILPSE